MMKFNFLILSLLVISAQSFAGPAPLMAANAACNGLDLGWTPAYSSLVAYLPMNGLLGGVASGAKVNDVFGTSNGTTNGAGLTYTAGKLEQAIKFDGSHYISIPNSAPANVCAAITVMFWVKWNAPNTSNYAALVSNWNGCGTDAAWAVVQSGTTQRIQISVNTTATFNQNLFGTTTPLDGSWHHIAVTITAAGAGILYVDGAVDNSKSYSEGAGICSPTTPILIGTGNCAASFPGTMAEFSIWSTVLTQTQIQTIYNRQVNGIH